MSQRNKNNPLFYDLSTYPEETFRQGKSLRSYRDDRTATQEERKRYYSRGRGGFLPRPRKQQIEKWLEGLYIIVITPQALTLGSPKDQSAYQDLIWFGEMPPQGSKILYQGKELTEIIREYQDSPYHLHIAPENPTFFGFSDQYTPFMMIHDIGEILYGDDWSVGAESYDWKTRKLYLPRVRHIFQKTKTEKGTKLIGTTYITSNLSDRDLDLWALYAMKNNLTVDDFLWWDDLDFLKFQTKKKIQENASKIKVSPNKFKRDVVRFYNSLFNEYKKSLFRSGGSIFAQEDPNFLFAS